MRAELCVDAFTSATKKYQATASIAGTGMASFSADY